MLRLVVVGAVDEVAVEAVAVVGGSLGVAASAFAVAGGW